MLERSREFEGVMRRLEAALAQLGVLDAQGRLVAGIEGYLPRDLAGLGCVDTPAELAGILKIAKDAREGKALSPAVLKAARLMAQEILIALEQGSQTQSRRLLLRPDSQQTSCT